MLTSPPRRPQGPTADRPLTGRHGDDSWPTAGLGRRCGHSCLQKDSGALDCKKADTRLKGSFQHSEEIYNRDGLQDPVLIPRLLNGSFTMFTVTNETR